MTEKELVDLFRSNVRNDSWPAAREHGLRCVCVVLFDHARNALTIINNMRHLELRLPPGAPLFVPEPSGFSWMWREFASTVTNDRNGAIAAAHQCLLQGQPDFVPWGAMVWINSAPEHGGRWMVSWRDRWNAEYKEPYQVQDISPDQEPPPMQGSAAILRSR
jgi:hypothetical protein